MSKLTAGELVALSDAIVALDPEGEVVQLDTQARQVRYSTEILQHEAIRDYVGDEEPVRAYFVAWLCTAGGYPRSAIELERRYPFGRDSNTELDIRVSREGSPDIAYALIEMKAPHDYGDEEDGRIEGQLFAIAGREPDCQLLSLVTAEVGSDGTVGIKSVTIAYEPTLTYQRWTDGGRPHVDDFPVNYDVPTQAPFAPETARDLRTDVNLGELERLRRQLHDRLWGGSRDDNRIYAWLVKLFLTKIHDEKDTDDAEPYAFQVLHHGDRKESPAETLARVNQRWHEAHERYVDPNADHVEPLEEFSAHETQWVVERLQAISLTAAGQSSGDLLGAFFEAITREGFKQSKGLFFTHYNLAVFMLEVLQVADLAARKLRSRAHPNDRLPYIIDPSCGSGTFLLAAMRLVTQHVQDTRTTLARNAEAREQLQLRFPKTAPNTWAKDFVYGIEKREDLAVSTKVNMVLHRDGHTHVYHDDGLALLNDVATRHGEEKFRPHADPDGVYDKPVAETFDIVITNPPFSITLDDDVRAHLAETFDLAADRNSENLFLERWYQLLKHRGRLAAVLPESFFSTAENLLARLFLFAHFDIRAIVSLPAHAFQPWTPTRTSLLFAQKKAPADERLWKDAFGTHRTDVAASVRAGRLAAGRIISPGRRTTQEQLANHLADVHESLDALALKIADGVPGTTEWALRANELLKSLSIDAEAFSRTVNEIGGLDYTGVLVGEVGYRRTKRAENERRNDLFRAVVDIDGVTKIVRNLNDASSGWRIMTADDGEDALSVLRKESLWRS